VIVPWAENHYDGLPQKVDEMVPLRALTVSLLVGEHLAGLHAPLFLLFLDLPRYQGP